MALATLNSYTVEPIDLKWFRYLRKCPTAATESPTLMIATELGAAAGKMIIVVDEADEFIRRGSRG
jgi:hypothetical protein